MGEINNQAPGQQNYPKRENTDLESAQNGDEIVAGANRTDQLEKIKDSVRVGNNTGQDKTPEDAEKSS